MKRMKQKKAFQGGINVTDLSFKKGTPNIRTIKPPSTSASSSVVSTSTAQLVSRQQQQTRTIQQSAIRVPTPPQEEDNLMFKPTAVSMKPAARKFKRKTKSKVRKVPDFFTPEKGVLLLGTLRPNGVCDVVPDQRSASTSQQKSSKPRRSQKAAPRVCVQMSQKVLQEDKPIVLSWQPLGSPMRRMKRAMRFVQQNTCVTQRVTVDVGGIARWVKRRTLIFFFFFFVYCLLVHADLILLTLLYFFFFPFLISRLDTPTDLSYHALKELQQSPIWSRLSSVAFQSTI